MLTGIFTGSQDYLPSEVSFSLSSVEGAWLTGPGYTFHLLMLKIRWIPSSNSFKTIYLIFLPCCLWQEHVSDQFLPARRDPHSVPPRLDLSRAFSFMPPASHIWHSPKWFCIISWILFRVMFYLGHLRVSSLPTNTGHVCPVLLCEVPSCWISLVLPELLPHSNIFWAKLLLAWNVTVRERKDTRKLFFLGRGSCAGGALVQLNVSRVVRRLLEAVQ